MTIQLRTVAKVYCDGGVHQGLEFSILDHPNPMTASKAHIRMVGWTIAKDGKVYCPQHTPRRKK